MAYKGFIVSIVWVALIVTVTIPINAYCSISYIPSEDFSKYSHTIFGGMAKAAIIEHEVSSPNLGIAGEPTPPFPRRSVSVPAPDIMATAKLDGPIVLPGNFLTGYASIRSNIVPVSIALEDVGVAGRWINDGAEGISPLPGHVDGSTAQSKIENLPLTSALSAANLPPWLGGALIGTALGLLGAAVLYGIIHARSPCASAVEDRQLDSPLRRMAEATKVLIESADVEAALQRITFGARYLVRCHQAVASVCCDRDNETHTVSRSEAFNRSDEASGALHCNRATGSVLIAPLLGSDGNRFGLLQLSDKYDEPFTSDDEVLLAEWAHIASIVIQKLQMNSERQAALRDAEMQRTLASQAQHRAEETRREVETILSSISDGVFALDRAWRFTYLNEQAARSLARCRTDLVGRNVWLEFPDAVGTPLQGLFQKAGAEGSDIDVKMMFPGLHRWFHFRAFPHADGITVYFQDISASVEKEEQLHQAQKMEVTGQLASGLAHDFNNLLGIVLGNAELLQENTAADIETRELAGMIAAAAAKGVGLTRRLLRFSGRQSFSMKSVDVNQLLRDFDPLIRHSLGGRYTIRLDLEDPLPAVLIDAGQLENAVLNLTINARDAMPDGGMLTISTRYIRDGIAGHPEEASPLRPVVVIGVQDTGVGMSPDMIARASQPFFTTKKERGGTGLGLPMVYAFTQQCGGHTEISSDLGVGTLVRLHLPTIAHAAAESS